MEKLPDFDRAKEMLEKILNRRLDWVEILAWLNKLSVSKPKKLVVYALEMNNGTVKIGVSKNLLQRMQSISYATGLKILRNYHTDFAPAEIARIIEISCHIKFEYGRVYGEYFNISFDEACNELARYQKKIETANEKSNEDYQKAVNRAWKIFNELEEYYFNRPTAKQSDFLATFADFVTLERERLVHDRDRFNFEREQFNLANSEESKKIAKAQLLRELASASGNNQTLRSELIRYAAELVTGKSFADKINYVGDKD